MGNYDVDLGELPQIGGQSNVTDHRLIDNWYTLPVWKRDQIMRQKQQEQLRKGAAGAASPGGGGIRGSNGVEVPQMAGGKMNINDIGRFVPEFQNMPQWKRDQILQSVQARNAEIEAGEAKQRQEEQEQRDAELRKRQEGAEAERHAKLASEGSVNIHGAGGPRAIEGFVGGWS